MASLKTWSVPAGSFGGTEWRLHWSFLFLALFVLLPAVEHTGAGLVHAALLLGCIFLAVLLHELGHAIAAAICGAQRGTIMLFPFGGVPLREGFQERRQLSLKDETIISLAGPVTNLLAAGVAALVSWYFYPQISLLSQPVIALGYTLKSFVWVNLFLAMLNLAPAYPLDAGRILRGYFAQDPKVDFNAATRRAVAMGQVFATFLIIAGVPGNNHWLMVAGFFLFLGVQLEDRSLLFHSVIESVKLEEVMLTDFSTLSPADTLEDALNKAVHSLQDDFPVLRGDDMVGVISKQGILEALRKDGNGYVQAAMEKAFSIASRGESLAHAFRTITAQKATIIPVMEENKLVGIVTLQNLMHSMGLLAQTKQMQKKL